MRKTREEEGFTSKSSGISDRRRFNSGEFRNRFRILRSLLGMLVFYHKTRKNLGFLVTLMLILYTFVLITLTGL